MRCSQHGHMIVIRWSGNGHMIIDGGHMIVR